MFDSLRRMGQLAAPRGHIDGVTYITVSSKLKLQLDRLFQAFESPVAVQIVSFLRAKSSCWDTRTIRFYLVPSEAGRGIHRLPLPDYPPSSASHCSICFQFRYHRPHHLHRLRIQSHSCSQTCQLGLRAWRAELKWGSSLLVTRILHEIVIVRHLVER